MSTTDAAARMRNEIVDLLPRLRRFARNLTRNVHDADDVVQIAIERALSHSHQWRSDARLDSWMFKIIRNAWIDTVRAKTRHERIFAPAEAGESIGESVIERETDVISVQAAMARLPEDQRVAVGLVLIEGLPYKEAADVLEIPIGTLTSRLARGRDALQRMLAPGIENGMNYSDETLMAFADGEIDVELGAQIEKALQSDPDLARRVAAHLDLRRRLQSAYALELDEPIPDRLLTSLLMGPAQAARTQGSKIVSLDASRAARSGKSQRSWSAPQWGTIAASLFVGVGAGYLAWHTSNSGAVADQRGVLVAQAALSRVLSQTLAGEAIPGSAAKVVLSYQSKTGELCRSFSDAAIAGIACRHGRQWRIRLLAQGVPGGENATGGYRPAGSAMPPSILQTINGDIAGEPLDAKAESEARARGWQAK